MAMEFTTANFEQEVLNSEVPVLVDFWAAPEFCLCWHLSSKNWQKKPMGLTKWERWMSTLPRLLQHNSAL